MAQPQRAIPQSKEQLLKSYTKRMKDDIRSIVDNYTEIFKLARVSLQDYWFVEVERFIVVLQIAYFLKIWHASN